MVMSRNAVIGFCVDNFPSFRRQRAHADSLDYWIRGQQGLDQFEQNKTGIFVPNPYSQTEEHIDLSQRSYSPWVALVVDALAQTMFLDGIRRAGAQENLRAWEAWQRNGMDARQSPLYRGALGHGLSFMVSLPGVDRLTGDVMPKFRGYSARRLACFYDEDDDDFPLFALGGDPYVDQTNGESGWTVIFIDEEAVHYLSCKGMGDVKSDWTYISYDIHDTGVPPVVRYTNMLDLDGRATGEVEPIIPIAKRIDQDTYDRLIVQRYGAWKIRYITGLVRPKDMSEEKYRAGLMQLKVGDFLISQDKDTKFGTLPETQLQGFIAAREADLRDLAAVRQLPPHVVTGQAPQMQPESLTAINQGFNARSLERKTSFGESHERLFRIAAKQMGVTEEARAWDLQSRWRDTEARSLSQTADALGKIAQQLRVPVEMLWERIEGWTDSDTARAKELLESGTIDQLIAQFEQSGMLGQSGAPLGAAA